MSYVRIPNDLTSKRVINIVNKDGGTAKLELFLTTDVKTEERVIGFKANTNDFTFTAEQAVNIDRALTDLILEANQYNIDQNPIIVTKDTIRKFIEDGRIEKIIFEYLCDDPKNENYKKFKIQPIWKQLREPSDGKGYYFIDYLCLSPFEVELRKQLSFYGGYELVEFKNFNYREYQLSMVESLKK